MGVQPGRVTAVQQTTEVGPFAEIPLDRTGPALYRFLHVGALTERKGVRQMFAAFRALAEREPERQIELVMIGEGALESELRSFALPPNVRVDWIGHVPYDQLPEWYRRAGILVFPTLGDEWGLVVNEAMAAGIPVLGSNLSGAVLDLLRDGENGWAFDPTDLNKFVGALQRTLKTSPAALLQMRGAARETALQLQPSVMAARIARVLRAVCKEA
jgi:glycosyltransferase involved in cell wall biosynthesis